MLRKLRIENFKGWKDTGDITLSPITLFFGANSSGKSSIGQFLMMLKQTVESSDRKVVFNPGSKNTAVQLGSYKDMVFQHDIENKINFQYAWDFSDILKFKNLLTNDIYKGNRIHFDAEVGLSEKEQQSLFVNYFSYKLFDQDQEVVSLSLEKKHDYKNEYQVNSSGYSLVRQKGRAWGLRSPLRFYGFPDEVVAYYQNADFVQDFNLKHEKLFRSIFYLGPFRTKAERLYSWTGIEPENVGYQGENSIACILAARNRRLSLGYKKHTKPFEEIIAMKLKQMELIDIFKVRSISKERQEYEVKVRTKGSRDLVDLPDVGFGVSQVLPVLVQCFYAPRNSIILMEQPEIHLHPSAQSLLADVLIDVVNSREYGRDRNVQLIIETHSEHFLRRMQRRIAENRIEQSLVSAYFANITNYPPSLTPLELDKYGNIYNWPENFFGDEITDIKEQSRAAMLKKLKDTQGE